VEAQQKVIAWKIINQIFHVEREINKIPFSFFFMTFGNVLGISMSSPPVR
jgi:hypothetical protein